MKLGRRDKIYLGMVATAIAGALILFAAIGGYVWFQSVSAEETRLQKLAERIGQRAENAIIDARALLVELNDAALEPCSPKHLELMQDIAIARTYVRGIGYWRAAERQCGTGLAEHFTPPKASRIYDSGMIAWWPGEETEVGGVQLFLMRFGRHDVVIDPRLLLNSDLLENHEVGLWVEGLLMTTSPKGVVLPEPETLEQGLTVDSKTQRTMARFSLGTIFPIDVVAVQHIQEFWSVYLPTILTFGAIGIGIIWLWIVILLKFSRSKLGLLAELKAAIADRKIEAYYQPVVDLSTGQCVGAESLARWTTEDGSRVGPDVFIPLAEDNRLISDLTISMLHSILTDMGDLLRRNPQLSINLNLSAQDLESDRLMIELDSAIKQAKLKPACIKLEITERALVDTDEARKRISTLRSRGHTIAIDDFGTGYSSLSYLESFELDVLKIDKAFVDAIDTHAVTSNVIVHVIEVAKSLELDIIAEGIEESHQASWLVKQGVRLGQGYFYAKPMASREFKAFVRKNNGKQ